VDPHADISLVLSDGIPNNFIDIFCPQLVKDTIRTKDNEINLVAAILEDLRLRIADDHTLHPAQVWVLGLQVPKGPGDRKPPRSHPVRPQEGVRVICLFKRHMLLDVHLLDQGCGIVAFEDGLGLVDFAPISQDPVILSLLHGFVVGGECLALSSLARAHHSSAISNIDDVDIVIDHHNG